MNKPSLTIAENLPDDMVIWYKQRIAEMDAHGVDIFKEYPAIGKKLEDQEEYTLEFSYWLFFGSRFLWLSILGSYLAFPQLFHGGAEKDAQEFFEKHGVEVMYACWFGITAIILFGCYTFYKRRKYQINFDFYHMLVDGLNLSWTRIIQITVISDSESDPITVKLYFVNEEGLLDELDIDITNTNYSFDRVRAIIGRFYRYRGVEAPVIVKAPVYDYFPTEHFPPRPRL